LIIFKPKSLILMYSADLSATAFHSHSSTDLKTQKNAADFNQSTKVRAGSMKDSAISCTLFGVAKAFV
jgi:hypothetical protein